MGEEYHLLLGAGIIFSCRRSGSVVLYYMVQNNADFYRSPLGAAARDMLLRRIRKFWPNLANLRLLGVGDATPWLGDYLGETERAVAFFSKGKKAVSWPPSGRGLAVQGDMSALPFQDRSFDRVLLAHALESAPHPGQSMREIWRILADDGRVLALVPNRRGLWARYDRTPFGQGRSFSLGQLIRLMEDNMFTPEQSAGALYMPPVDCRLTVRVCSAFEKIAPDGFPAFCGVIALEARKEIYAASGTGQKSPSRRVYAPISPA